MSRKQLLLINFGCKIALRCYSCKLFYVWDDYLFDILLFMLHCVNVQHRVHEIRTGFWRYEAER